MSSGTSVQVASPRALGAIWRFLRAERTARWTSRIVLLAVWQLAAGLSDHVATPLQTVQFIVDEFHRPYRGMPLTVVDNELVRNLAISLQRGLTAIPIVLAIGLPVGYAIGR